MNALAATLLFVSIGQSSDGLGPALLPTHYAADARTYLMAELLRRGGVRGGGSPAQVRTAPPWIRLPATPAESKADRVAIMLLQARLDLADLKSQSDDSTSIAALASRVDLLKHELAELRAAGERENRALLRLQRRILRGEIERELAVAEQSMTAENPRLARLRQRAKAVLPLL